MKLSNFKTAKSNQWLTNKLLSSKVILTMIKRMNKLLGFTRGRLTNHHIQQGYNLLIYPITGQENTLNAKLCERYEVFFDLTQKGLLALMPLYLSEIFSKHNSCTIILTQTFHNIYYTDAVQHLSPRAMSQDINEKYESPQLKIITQPDCKVTHPGKNIDYMKTLQSDNKI